ncbi:MAG TPA: nuclear transport factor 2 family protein [Polyangiaceae bacterium]|nr:nuclear transport factor 2 family protein [Polyangiaceae bacterium]
MGKTFGWAFYDEQIALINAGDADALVERHYDVDASLVRFDGVVRGHDALKALFRNYIQALGALRIISTEQFIESDDAVFFEATAETKGLGIVRVYDAFVLRNGKATHHFTGVK